MYIELGIIITLSASTAILGLLLVQTKIALRSEQNSMDKILDAAARADDRAEEQNKMLKDFMAKPVQTFIPQGSIELMTQALVHSLSQTLNAPMEIPIFPREKPPKEPQQS